MPDVIRQHNETNHISGAAPPTPATITPSKKVFPLLSPRTLRSRPIRAITADTTKD
ncbi:uncharacterized protein TrAtP1_009858 [Trichoderma atroviride]|uniref:uncharacterized protein n=1 Tax=Hypocrea atroviridis TaxID=63577 RepID=UPI003332B99F|nr:hypothetical protein TrAtP1_009858 [Trichoderma atroviride]